MADAPGSLISEFDQVASLVRPSLLVTLSVVILIALALPGCGSKPDRRGVPLEIEGTIATISDDIAAERYQKVYDEASDLWRQDSTFEQSTAAFKTLNAKLGKVENRIIHSATEQHNSSGPLKGDAFIIAYKTKFERGEGMETFTLVKRDGRWLLARYFVNSTALN